MEILNRYFIVDTPITQEILEISVENENSIRYNLDGTKAVIKLPLGDTNNYPQLSFSTEYNHQEILQEILKPEWNPEDII